MASNKQAKESLNRFKMEVASELGVPLKDGYNGDLTSAQNGSVGGEMVRQMIKKQEEEKSVEEAKVEEVKVEEPPVAEILQMSTNINTDTPDAVESVTTTTKTPLDELLKNNELTEDQVVWSDYTKAERRQIRAHLNALATEATENA